MRSSLWLFDMKRLSRISGRRETSTPHTPQSPAGGVRNGEEDALAGHDAAEIDGCHQRSAQVTANNEREGIMVRVMPSEYFVARDCCGVTAE